MDYFGFPVFNTISVDRIFAVCNLTLNTKYSFPVYPKGCFSLVYAKKGAFSLNFPDSSVFVEKNKLCLFRGSIPTTATACDTASEMAVVSFFCTGLDPVVLDKAFFATEHQRLILAEIFESFKNGFSLVVSDGVPQSIVKKKNAPSASSQLVAQGICSFLISILQMCPHTALAKASVHSGGDSSALARHIVEFMKQNISKNITIGDLVCFSGYEKTAISRAFNKCFNMGAIDYFIRLKINKAKELLSLNTCTITSVAEQLGYSGIHYFSRQFKKIEGISPSEYIKSRAAGK